MSAPSLTAAELDAMLEVAKKHGVASLAIQDTLTVAFFPPEFNVLPETTDKSIPGGWKRPPNLEDVE